METRQYLRLASWLRAEIVGGRLSLREKLESRRPVLVVTRADGGDPEVYSATVTVLHV